MSDRGWTVSRPPNFSSAAAEVIGKRAMTLFPFLEETGEDACYRKALAGESVVSTNRRYWVADRGREGCFDACYSPLRDDKGVIVGAVAVVRDITDQKRQESLLKETESRFKNMADVSPVLLWMSGRDSLCTFFNQTWLDFTGRTLEEEWGVGWAEGIYFEDLEKCISTYMAAFNAREVFEMEYRLRRHDGEYRWILDRGTPRYEPGGVFTGYIGSCIDITDRKRLETQLMKAVRDRDDFLSIASHELRTPLTTLRLEVEALKRSINRSPDAAALNGYLDRGVDAVGSQTTRLVSLVEKLLDVSRLASGHLEVQLGEVDLSELVSEVIVRLRPALDAAGCPLERVELTSVVGQWDRHRLEQVISNLIANAIKYAASESRQKTKIGSSSASSAPRRERTTAASVWGYGSAARSSSRKAVSSSSTARRARARRSRSSFRCEGSSRNQCPGRGEECVLRWSHAGDFSECMSEVRLVAKARLDRDLG